MSSRPHGQSLYASLQSLMRWPAAEPRVAGTPWRSCSAPTAPPHTYLSPPHRTLTRVDTAAKLANGMPRGALPLDACLSGGGSCVTTATRRIDGAARERAQNQQVQRAAAATGVGRIQGRPDD